MIASEAPTAKAAIRSPSTTRCGFPSASVRSPSEVGSAPMRLATAIFRSLSTARAARHFSAVGNPAPPRPRSPAASISPMTPSGDRWRIAFSSAAYPPWARYDSRLPGSMRPRSVSRRGSPPSRMRISGERPPTVATGSALPGNGRPAAAPAIPAVLARAAAASLLDQVPKVLRGEWPVHERVDADRRGDRTGRDIGGGLQGEGAVGGRLPGADPQQSLGLAQQRLAAGETACGAGADRHDVSLDREQAEPAKPGRTEDLCPVDHHPVADPSQGAFRQVAVPRLDGVEDRDQGLRPRPESIDDLVDERGVDHLVPARRIAHRSGLEPRAPVCVRVLALVIDLRHAVPDAVSLSVEAAHVDRLDRTNLRALEADLALVLAERVVDQVESAAPALGHLRTLFGVLARDLGRKQVAQGGGHAGEDAAAGDRHRSRTLLELEGHDRDRGPEQVDERERQEHLPRHAHELVDADPGEGGAHPDRDEDEEIGLGEEPEQAIHDTDEAAQLCREGPRREVATEEEGHQDRAHDEERDVLGEEEEAEAHPRVL